MNTTRPLGLGDSDEADIEIAEGQQVMPFYLVLDQSVSMSGDLETLRHAVESLVAELRSNALADENILLGVISFGSSAQVTIPLSRLSSIGTVPQLTSLGGTDFSAAWHAYDQAFRADKKAIRAKNGQIHRPCVFFLTDGAPRDRNQFRNAFLSTQGKDVTKGWPYVVAYGFRDAPADVLKDIAYPDFGEKLGQWFLDRGSDPVDAIRRFTMLVFAVVAHQFGAQTQPSSLPTNVLSAAGLAGADIVSGSA